MRLGPREALEDHAASMPHAARAELGLPLGLVPLELPAQRFRRGLPLSTRHQRFTLIHLLGLHLMHPSMHLSP